MNYSSWLSASNIMPREEWLKSTPWIGGSPKFAANQVQHMTKHYMGGNGINCGNIPQLLRNMQNNYRVSRGYDLGYSFGTDQLGNKYEIRGLRVRAASDGGVSTNTITVSCLGMSPNMFDPMTPEMEYADESLMNAVREWCSGAQHWVGHRDVFGTSCPGNPWYDKVTAGELEPTTWPPPPVVDWTPIEDEEPMIGPILFFSNAGNVGHDYSGNRFSVPVDGTWFKASGNGQSFVWVRAKDVEDVKAQARQLGQSDEAAGPVANLDAFGVLVGEKPS
jgi:hypothetical protein